VCGPIDPDGAPGHDDHALKRCVAAEVIGKVQRLFVGATSAHDRDRTVKTRKLTYDAKQAGRIGQVTELRGVFGAKSAHQLSARG